MTTTAGGIVSDDHAKALGDSTRLAIERTRLAHERTLMAWVRTSTSLISFGFGVYKFFQGMSDTQGISERHHVIGPREFALALISVGVGALIMATLEHRKSMGDLQREYGLPPRSSTATRLAWIVSALGLVTLILVLSYQ